MYFLASALSKKKKKKEELQKLWKAINCLAVGSIVEV